MNYKKLNENLDHLVKCLSEKVEVDNVKERIKAAQDGDKKTEKQLKKELKKAHAEILKDWNKSLSGFMKQEIKRLKKEYPNFDIEIFQVGKNTVKDVSGNSQSAFGDWYDSNDYRLSMHHKLK